MWGTAVSLGLLDTSGAGDGVEAPGQASAGGRPAGWWTELGKRPGLKKLVDKIKLVWSKLTF